MTPDLLALLADCRRFIRGVATVFQFAPESMHAGHLQLRADELIQRIDAATKGEGE